MTVHEFCKDGGAHNDESAQKENPCWRELPQEEHFNAEGDENGNIKHEEGNEAVNAPESFVIQDFPDSREHPSPEAEKHGDKSEGVDEWRTCDREVREWRKRCDRQKRKYVEVGGQA